MPPTLARIIATAFLVALAAGTHPAIVVPNFP
jgi:hypothetical protein